MTCHTANGNTESGGGITAPLKTRSVVYAGKIVRWICILFFVFAAVQLLYGIYLACLPQERFSVQLTRESWWVHPDGDPLFLSGQIPFSVIPAVENGLHNPKGAQMVSLLTSWLTCLCWGGCCLLLDGIFSQLQEGDTPFTVENSRRLRILGLLQIAGSLLPSLLQSVLNWLWVSDHFQWQFPLDWIFGIMMLALSSIFAYGCQLQQEYDQTL